MHESLLLKIHLDELLSSNDPNQVDYLYNMILWRAGRIRDYCRLKTTETPPDFNNLKSTSDA